MRAKNKLNVAYAMAAVLMAGLAADITGSWIVFWLALIGIVICCLHTGEIRK